MIFNRDILFIHLGKTGGISVANYLCQVLRPPVVSVVRHDEFHKLKQSGHEIMIPWKRHANLKEAAKFLEGKNIQLSDFKWIIVVIRDPVDLGFSYYKHLRNPQYLKRLSRNRLNQERLAAAQKDYDFFACQPFTHHRGKLKDYFEIDGQIPKNMKIVRFENLAEEITEITKPYSIKDIRFPHLNESPENLARPKLSQQAIEHIKRKYHWIYDKGFYPLPANGQSIKPKKYLFIGGVGRSGTSALTEIVGSHPKVVLGMERYNKLFSKQDFTITPAHFEKERFLDLREGDTFYTDFNMFSPHINIAEKWDQAFYVGLKYPRLVSVYELTAQALGEFKLIYIYRNIFDVTESWNRRLTESSNWPRQRDYKRAVEFWNNSLRLARKLTTKNNSIVCISYEDLLFSDKSIQPLFDWLELEIDKKVIETLNEKRKLAPDKKAQKGTLPDEQKAYISQHARFDIYEEFNSKFNILA